MKFWKSITALAAALSITGVATAQSWYVSGSVGYAQHNESDNSGSTGAFTTGNGEPVLPFGTPIDAGTPYGWQTEFEGGLALAGEVGLTYGSALRSGVELVYTQADVDTHSGVTVAGIDIDGVDAALLTGSQTQLGASVGDVVADGRGEITTLGAFANLYYDFNRGQRLSPYVGAGIGFLDTDVTYNPSGVGIIDDGETKFAYQLKAGAAFGISPQVDVFGEYAYRASEEIEVSNDLFPGTLEIENQQNVFSIGVRYRFG